MKTKKTLNQLKSSRRSLALMLLAGMVTNLRNISRDTHDTEIQEICNHIMDLVFKLMSIIRNTTYESWKA